MRDEKAPDNVHPATGPPPRQPSFDQVFVAQFSCGPPSACGPRPRTIPPRSGYNILNFLCFFVDGNFDPGSRNHWIVAAFAASGGGPTWTHRGVLETWPDPTGRKTFFRTRPLDRPPPQGARGRSLPGARRRGRGGRGTRPVPISSPQRPLTQPCVSKDRSGATIWP
jgi:hypothetical protein